MQDLVRELRPHIVRAGVDMARAMFVGNRTQAQPEFRDVGSKPASTDEHGCPYCAARKPIWAALGECLLAAKANDAGVRQMFADRVVMELEHAFREADTIEVVSNPAGAKLLADIARASADRDEDYDRRARELWRIHEECERLAGIRNGQA